MLKLILRDDRNNGVYLAGPISKSWVDSGHSSEQLCYRVMEAMGKEVDYSQPPDPLPDSLAVTAGVAIDGYHYAVIRNGNPHFFASFGPFEGPVPPGLDIYGR